MKRLLSLSPAELVINTSGDSLNPVSIDNHHGYFKNKRVLFDPYKQYPFLTVIIQILYHHE